MNANPQPLETDCRTVKARLAAGEPIRMLDCRERDEHALVHLEAARLIPMSELQARVAELDGDRQSELVVFCHHGGRSLRVAMWLRQQGFAKATSMAGGIDRWATEIDPSLPRY